MKKYTKSYSINKNGIKELCLTANNLGNDQIYIYCNTRDENTEAYTYNAFHFTICPNELLYDISKDKFYLPNYYGDVFATYENEINDFLKSLEHELPYIKFEKIEKKKMYMLRKRVLKSIDSYGYIPFYKIDKLSKEKLNLEYARTDNGVYLFPKLFSTDFDFFFCYPIKPRQISENSYILANIDESEYGTTITDIFSRFEMFLDIKCISVNDNMMYYSLSMDQDTITDKGKLFIHKFIS